MVHQFEMKRLWEDALEMNVTFELKAKWCEVTVNEYVTVAEIEALVSALQAFNARNGKLVRTWTLDSPLVHVSLTFELANTRGTVRVTAMVEQMKGDSGDMKAVFSFETTMGQIDDLQRQLSNFLPRETNLVESLRSD